jgi:hypothetical protein
MLKKTLMITTLAAGLGVAALPAAAGHEDRAAGAIIGGTIGALIGNSVNGGDGALVGALIGGVAGAGIADSRYHGGYSYRGAPAYYAPRYAAPTYVAPTYVAPRYGNGYHTASARRDSDRDGVADRYDRAPYNPRWR